MSPRRTRRDDRPHRRRRDLLPRPYGPGAIGHQPAARRPGCPRPDKEAWATREAVEQVITMMRAQARPAARDLAAYECGCGWWHAGNRLAAPVPQRWASAYPDE